MTLIVGSLFSGIGGFDLGFERAGMSVAWQCEYDESARRILARHWPDVPCHPDVKELSGDGLTDVDVLCGGFPCQDLSVAGRRAGLAGERSGLFHEFMRLAADLSPRWVVIENVPGLLSSNDGRDMGTVLGTLADLGYGWAYRVLDAQYFGVAQRRRRVFIVGHSGGRADRAAQVLLESASCDGDTAPSRTPRESLAGTLGGGSGRRGFCDDLDRSGAFIPVAATLTGGSATSPGVNRPGRRQEDDTNIVPVAFMWQAGGNNSATTGDMAVAAGMAVRRLVPVECERLQGFPDGWTDGESDSARYARLGNAVAVPVATWIGRRLAGRDVA